MKTFNFFNILRYTELIQKYFSRLSFKNSTCKTKYYWEEQYSKHDSFNYESLIISNSFLTFIGMRSKHVTDRSNEEENSKEWTIEKDISHRITLAELAIKANDYKKAEFILEQALLLYEKKKSIGVTCIYDMLATLAYREGKVEKAQGILEKVISYLNSTGISSDNDRILTFRLKLARILSKSGKNTEADTIFRRCLDILRVKQLIGLNDEESVKLRINCLYWYGKHLVHNRKFPEAKQCFDTAYILSAKVKTLSNNQVMVILYNLSEISFATGDSEGALKHLLNAIILGRTTNSPDLPMYYNKLGLIYLHKGLLHEAKHWCESGRDRAKQLHNKQVQSDGEMCLKKINEALKLTPLKI